MYKIIDFHQHLLVPIDILERVNRENNIIRSVIMPVDIGKYSFKELVSRDRKPEGYPA